MAASTSVAGSARRRARLRRAIAKEPSGPSVLSLAHVEYGYQLGGTAVPVLRSVDLTVLAGEVVAVVGRSGSGKSTLLHVAGGLLAPKQGSVTLTGIAVDPLGAGERALLRRRTVGLVFQAFHLLPGLSVAENVALPLLLDGHARTPALHQASALLDAVELTDRGEHLPGELSGGELQRAATARALVTDPPLVLADEPTGNLDLSTAEMVVDLLVDRIRQRGTAMVLVTHDPSIASRADRILTMADGTLT